MAPPVHYERHRPEQTTLHSLVQQHAASFIAHTEAGTGSELPRFIKDEFDAFLECGILAPPSGGRAAPRRAEPATARHHPRRQGIQKSRPYNRCNREPGAAAVCRYWSHASSCLSGPMTMKLPAASSPLVA